MTPEAEQRPASWRRFLERAQEEVSRFGIFALLRQVEARAPKPRIGRSRLPEQNIVELAQVPTLAFPAATLASIDATRERPLVRGYYLGLTGPMAPLPLHLTEVAYNEERNARSQPFGRFLDLIAGRMLQFFYRAWADSQPAAHADRPGDDRFAGYLAALTGATQAARPNTAFPPEARLQYAALFVGRRSVGAIEDALSHLLGTSVIVHPFEPRWRVIDPEDRSRLGVAGGFATLGSDVVAGSRVRQVSDAYRVTIRAGSFHEYQTFLPSGRRYALATEALAAFAPTHLDWLIELEIAEEAVPRARLGGGTALGWTSWMTKVPASGDGKRRYRADTRLRRRVNAGKH